jgi:hypothetical protein
MLGILHPLHAPALAQAHLVHLLLQLIQGGVAVIHRHIRYSIIQSYYHIYSLRRLGALVKGKGHIAPIPAHPDEIMFSALNNAAFWARRGYLSIDFAFKRDRMKP